MLIVKTYVAPSNIHGMGVFTAAALRAGTRVWVFDPVIDQEITPAQLTALPDAAREVALARSFVDDDGRTILSRDNAVFLNHSEDPNTWGDAKERIALRDIAAGEELTEDYRHLRSGACKAFLECVGVR
jgi:SET domain-containing protein